MTLMTIARASAGAATRRAAGWRTRPSDIRREGYTGRSSAERGDARVVDLQHAEPRAVDVDDLVRPGQPAEPFRDVTADRGLVRGVHVHPQLAGDESQRSG